MAQNLLLPIKKTAQSIIGLCGFSSDLQYKNLHKLNLRR